MEAHEHNFSFYLKRFTGFILLLAMSAVFLFSAETKIRAIEPFEWTFTDILPVNITVAAILARIFIGLELLIGFFLLGHVALRKFTYKATIGILVILTVYLIVLIIKTGNSGNCGCFGDTVQMTPLNAIYKNLIMIAATIALVYLYPSKAANLGTLPVILLIAAFTVPFATKPVYIFTESKIIHEPININALYKYSEPMPIVDLRKGKHVIAFYSLTCPHCRHAAAHMQRLYKQYPELPFYAILGGHKEMLDTFLRDTKVTNLPYVLFNNSLEFAKMAGNSVPSIYWINNSVIERKSHYSELEPRKLKTWLEGKK